MTTFRSLNEVHREDVDEQALIGLATKRELENVAVGDRPKRTDYRPLVPFT